MPGNRLYKTASANTGATVPPSATFDFQPVPQGLVYTGTIQILGATAWSFHQATIGGILWAEWFGYQPGPVLQAIGGEVIEVTSINLLDFTPYQAVLIGRVDPENNYQGIWPEASNNVINPTQPDQTFPANPNGPGLSTFTATIAVGVPGQVLAIQFNGIGGTATGLRMTASAFPGTSFKTLYPYPPNVANLISPWWLVPVNDPVVSIFIESILNNVLGGNFFGNLNIAVLPGPLYTPVLQNPWDVGSGGSAVGRTTNEIAVGPSTTSTILPEPATGTMYRIRGISLRYIAAPASPQGLVMRGTGSAFLYWSSICPTAVAVAPNVGEFNFLVGGASARADPAEGINFTNNASQNGNVSLEYDIVPFPQIGLTA